MSFNKILSAATEAFKQNFSTMCRNSDNMVRKIDNETFNRMVIMLMDAAHAAGVAGLEEYLRENDITTATITTKDKVFRYKGTSTKEILTLFGTITVNRSMYYDEKNGGECFFPLDSALGLEKDDFATLDAREMLLFASSSCVPRELEELLKKCSFCRPSRTAIQNIINRYGSSMESMRAELARSVFDNQGCAPEKTKALVVSLDGVNVLLREAGNKKGRKNKRPASSPEHAGTTSCHNAMVGSALYYGNDNEGRPQRIRSIYNARMPQE